MYTYRRRNLQESLSAVRAGNADMVVCGEREGMQIQIQDSTNTNIRLLHDKVDPATAPQKELADLATKVNDLFEKEAKKLLAAKRAANPDPAKAERVEITVLLTDNGLQLAYAHGLERKEVAPTPSKPLARRLLGPLYPTRRFWVMPAHHGKPNPVTLTWWPWIVWAVVLAAAAFGVSLALSG